MQKNQGVAEIGGAARKFRALHVKSDEWVALPRPTYGPLASIAAPAIVFEETQLRYGRVGVARPVCALAGSARASMALPYGYSAGKLGHVQCPLTVASQKSHFGAVRAVVDPNRISDPPSAF